MVWFCIARTRRANQLCKPQASRMETRHKIAAWKISTLLIIVTFFCNGNHWSSGLVFSWFPGHIKFFQQQRGLIHGASFHTHWVGIDFTWLPGPFNYCKMLVHIFAFPYSYMFVRDAEILLRVENCARITARRKLCAHHCASKIARACCASKIARASLRVENCARMLRVKKCARMLRVKNCARMLRVKNCARMSYFPDLNLE